MPRVQDAGAVVPEVTPKPHWWWHDDDYVANDTWNWLAVAETVVAFCLYFWIASISPWPWLTTISFIAVPLLLLRSEASIQRGVVLLKGTTKDMDPTWRELWAIATITFIVSAGLEYWLVDWMAKNCLVGHSGWALLWRSLAIGAVAAVGALTLAVVVVIARAGAGAVSEAGAVAEAEAVAESVGLAVALAGSVAVAVALAGARAGSVAGAGAGSVALAVALGLAAAKKEDVRSSTFAIAATVTLGSLVIVGTCMASILIRMRATLTWPHLKEGLAAFSDNWYETVLVSNMRHAAALLPRAGLVSANYNVATASIGSHSDLEDVILTKILRVVITAVATVYRWNIKANSWIWWPLYLLLRRIQWEKHPLAPVGAPSDQRRTSSAFWSNGRLLTVLVLSIVVLFGYLIYPVIPKDFQALQHSWAVAISKHLPSNWQSLRYWLAVAMLLALINLGLCIQQMSSQYQEQLAKSDAHQKMTPDVEAGFDKAAIELVRARWLMFMCFLLLVYAVAIKFAIQQWPNTWGKVFWDWLKAAL
jgi:hypothetical protein